MNNSLTGENNAFPMVTFSLVAEAIVAENKCEICFRTYMHMYTCVCTYILQTYKRTLYTFFLVIYIQHVEFFFYQLKKELYIANVFCGYSNSKI